MKSVFTSAGAFLLLATLYAPSASALSTDEGKFTNMDGTSKFSDPDDQQPGFVGGGGGDGNSGSGFSVRSYGFSGDAAPGIRPNGPTLEWGDSGSDAFDHAYNHQGQ
jgi:hypothetical protein